VFRRLAYRDDAVDRTRVPVLNLAPDLDLVLEDRLADLMADLAVRNDAVPVDLAVRNDVPPAVEVRCPDDCPVMFLILMLPRGRVPNRAKIDDKLARNLGMLPRRRSTSLYTVIALNW
jgi:hypothetical protein